MISLAVGLIVRRQRTAAPYGSIHMVGSAENAADASSAAGAAARRAAKETGISRPAPLSSLGGEGAEKTCDWKFRRGWARRGPAAWSLTPIVSAPVSRSLRLRR
jgi:hypothetical protein